MNQKKMTLAAIACGVVCAVCVVIFMVSVQGQADEARAETLARYGGEQVEVCVATRDISAGERVDVGAVQMKLWVADLLPEGAVRFSSDVIGKTATSNIIKGEVVSTRRFEQSGKTLEVPQGKVAISVPAKEVQAVGGSLLPGMKVDVYSSGDTTTALVAEGVPILATSVAKDGTSLSGFAWVTLAASPEKVQELIAAASTSSLYFTLPGEPLDSATSGKSVSSTSSKSSNAKSQASNSTTKSSTSASGDASSAASSSGSSTVDGEGQ